MAVEATTLDAIAVSRIFLSLDNPRHIPFDNETKVIEHLCSKEDVFALARDIHRHGLNPLERFALIPISKSSKDYRDDNYFVAEGNRRLCALKLLNDPELAPAQLRKSFASLAEDWRPIKTVPGVVFKDREEVKLWLERIHSGPQGGIGRKEWNAEQKTRFHGENKNRATQSLLDYAQQQKMLTETERRGKLTTAQRFLSNEFFREVLGVDQSNPDDIARTRPAPDFDLLLKRFIRDLVAGEKVTSRMNKDNIVKYARSLSDLPGITSTRIQSESLLDVSKAPSVKRRATAPKQPERARHVQYENEIAKALKAFGNGKLESLYHSICAIELDPHTPIVAIGVWAFFETLTACAGRNEDTSFDSFLSKAKLISYGISDKALIPAITRIRQYGNTTKHHPISVIFNGDQLNNDMTALKQVILKCIEDASAKSR